MISNVRIRLLFLTFWHYVKNDGETNLSCYFCDHSEDFEATDDDRDLKCMTAFRELDDHRRLCVGDEVCFLKIVWRNDAFLEIHRGCSNPCRPRCLFDGYGVTSKTCTWCCNSFLCNGRADLEVFNDAATISSRYFTRIAVASLFGLALGDFFDYLFGELHLLVILK